MQLKQFIPPILYSAASRLRRRRYGWFGDYPTWEAAMKDSSGYDSSVILEKVKEATLRVKDGTAAFERDSVLFNEIEYSWPVLSGLLWAAARNNGDLSVLDFGGSLGSTYFQNRKFLQGLRKVEWSVVEQQQFVDCGNSAIANAELKFYSTLESCLTSRKPQLVLFSCVLQYLAKPFETIAETLRFTPEFIIADNMPFISGRKSRITVQRVDPAIYEASYPCWLLNRDTFLEAFTGYEVVERFTSELAIRMDGSLVPYEGFIFKRKA